MSFTVGLPDQLTPAAAKAQFGATHYTTMRDGITPQMYYKQAPLDPYVEDSPVRWCYLSFCGLWMGSALLASSQLEEIP